MALPELKVEIAWTSGFSTPAIARTWTDVTDYVVVALEDGIEITYGRSDELETVDPGQLTITFDNREGHFTPERTGSVFYPNVKKGRPIRVSVAYDGVWYPRGLWYVDAWPLEWPDATEGMSTVTVTATSRRARLDRSAVFLTSQIYEVFMSTSPQAYWPMTDPDSVVDGDGRPAFRDATSFLPGAPNRDDQYLTAFAPSAALTPVRLDETYRVVDETGLVRFPKASTYSGPFSSYVGGARRARVNTAGSLTVEVVAALERRSALQNFTLFDIRSPQFTDNISAFVARDVPEDADYGYVGMSARTVNPATEAVTYDDFAPPLGTWDGPSYLAATDGKLHHYAVTLTGRTMLRLYFDGALVQTLNLAPSGGSFQRMLTDIGFGSVGWNMSGWLGHGAIHNRALTALEIQERAEVATQSDATLEDRVKRVAGRLGVPEDEVSVEDSVSAPVTAQPESGRSGVEILDELATTTGGIVFDDRGGNLVMQARNHRYNAPTAFTLSAMEQEIQGDLSGILDDRYLINTLEITRPGVDEDPNLFINQGSVDDYGVYSDSIDMAVFAPTEVEAAAYERFRRYSQPKVRVPNVGVDVVNLEPETRAAVLGMDIGSRFVVADLPPQAPRSSLNLFCEGYTETIGATVHVITANTTPADDPPAWTIEHPTFGAIDSVAMVVY